MKHDETRYPPGCKNCSSVRKKFPGCFCGILKPEFFKCFCKNACSETKRLDVCRNAVFEKIKRPLQNMDVPALLNFLSRNQDISHLNLANNNISDSGFIDLIDHIISYRNIYELDIQNNKITDIGTAYLLSEAEKIVTTRLILKSNKIDVQGSIDVACFLVRNKYVLHLNIADVDQTASSLIYFPMVLSPERLNSNKTLKSLDISRPNPGCMNYFDSSHFASVIGRMLKHNTSLQALHLQKYNFGCHDIEDMMSNAINNNALCLLDLGCNNIGDHGVAQLSKWLVKRPALRVLILSSNIITDHGARELSYSVPYSKLRSLNISYNKITDEGMVQILHTLKKTPLLRQFRIFGNCLGHPVATIINRMLISGVLDQNNIDVRPYEVDNVWYIAKYDGSRCKKEYKDIPYSLHTEVPAYVKSKPPSTRKYYKYVYSLTSDVTLSYSMITVASSMFVKDHGMDCKCCYCLQCGDACTCCKCKGETSSDWSIDSSIAKKVVIPPDPAKNIAYILNRVNSDTREDIKRWINIDEAVLKEDLRFLAEQGKIDFSSSESSIACTCSWVQLSMSSLKRHLEESSSKNVLIIPKNGSTLYDNACEDSSQEIVCDRN